jgi:putative oxidoreductase
MINSEMVLTWLTKHRDFGLLLLRLGLGIMFFLHGWPKLIAGPERWEALGGAMGTLGITFFPLVWGLLAALAETGGALLLAAGFLFRPACIVLAFTMLVATLWKYTSSGGVFVEWSHPAEMLIVFVSLLLIGPGRFSVDRS